MTARGGIVGLKLPTAGGSLVNRMLKYTKRCQKMLLRSKYMLKIYICQNSTSHVPNEPGAGPGGGSDALVWWCLAALCCSAIAAARWNCSGGSQSPLLGTSFWPGLRFPVYLGLWPVLVSPLSMSFLLRIWRFHWSLEKRKKIWPAGAYHRGQELQHLCLGCLRRLVLRIGVGRLQQ